LKRAYFETLDFSTGKVGSTTLFLALCYIGLYIIEFEDMTGPLDYDAIS
jgi:hypothetical protein